MRVVKRVVPVVLVACAAAVAAHAQAPSLTLGAAEVARSRLLGCDSAVVRLEVLTDHREITLPDGSVRASGSHEILAEGHNGAAWMRRFTDALLPAGREWTARVAPHEELDRWDDRVPWTVRVTAYAGGKLQGFWSVNLLDGWAGEGLGTPLVAFGLLAPVDSLRAVLADGMRPLPDAARRLRKIVEPDAAIVPLPERRRR